MSEEQIRLIIRDELQEFLASDRYIFHKTVQFLDGRKIIVGRTNGTSFGDATDQKVSVYGVAPVVQAGAITTPTAPGATYSQAEAASMKTAVDAIRVALTNIGITA